MLQERAELYGSGRSLTEYGKAWHGWLQRFVDIDGHQSQTRLSPLLSTQGKTFWETQSIWTVGHSSLAA